MGRHHLDGPDEALPCLYGWKVSLQIIHDNLGNVAVLDGMGNTVAGPAEIEQCWSVTEWLQEYLYSDAMHEQERQVHE